MMALPTVSTSGTSREDKEKLLAEYGDIREIYRHEINRLRSFSGWKSANVSPTQLAKAGFFSTASDDTVQCFVCMVKINQWKISDDPMREHQLLSPGCVFVLKGDSGNVPFLGGDQVAAQENLEKLKKKYEASSDPNDEFGKILEEKKKELEKKFPFSIGSEQVKSLGENQPSSPVHKKAPAAAANVSASPEEEDPLISLSLSNTGSLLRSTTEHQPGFTRDPDANVYARQELPPPAPMQSAATFGTTIFSIPQEEPPHRESASDEALRKVKDTIRAGRTLKEATEYCAVDDLIFIVDKSHSLEHAVIKNRWDSFVGWNHSHNIKIKALVEAGFYYTGTDDRVRCFHCNGGLCNWQREDVPWFEHYRWFGKCEYVRKAGKNEIVKTIIKTAKHIHGARERAFQHHPHHHGTGRTQCDPAAAAPDIWQTDNMKKLLSMGFSRTNIQSVIDKKGMGVVRDIDKMLDLLAKKPKQPSPVHVPASPAYSPAHVPKYQGSQGEELLSAHLCQVCRSAKLSLMFLPCRHLVTCTNCGIHLDHCPFCHKKVQATSKVQVK